MALRIALILAASVLMYSCATQRPANTPPPSHPSTASEKAAQLAEKTYLVHASDTVQPLNLPSPIVQKNDLLHIRVFSQSINPETDLPYNLPDAAAAGGGTAGVSPTAGFLVDDNGNIEYPQIGTVKVEGLTKEQVAARIKEKLKALNALYNPSVIVRFLNYKVTVLGEVKNPTTYTAATDRVSVLDALGMAGDVTEFGDRSNIRIARMQDGKMELGQIDLTRADFFTSPYFWLKQNDYVFVQPSERRKLQDERELRQDERELRQDARDMRKDARELKQEERQSVGQQIGIVSGIITSIALILNLLK